jgi:hypothetical protein
VLHDSVTDAAGISRLRFTGLADTSRPHLNPCGTFSSLNWPNTTGSPMKLAAILLLAAAMPAAADTTYIISVSNRVTEMQPSATVELWAVFEPGLEALAGVALDFLGTPDQGGFSDPHRVLDGPGTKDGDVAPDGDSVTGIISAQLCFDGIECFPDRSNPVLVWLATWSTSDFTQRTVPVATLTSKFDVYINHQYEVGNFFNELVEGSGEIVVGCYADCDGSGSLDVSDYLCFINLFEAGGAGADCDASSELDLFDFLCYVNSFEAGC